MYNIMFSLLVHEEQDVMLDQIINLNHFNDIEKSFKVWNGYGLIEVISVV